MKIEFNNLYTHFVFITLKRQPVIPEKNRIRIEKYITGIVKNNSSKLYAIYTNPEHMHILVSRAPTLSEVELATIISDSSEKFINENKLVMGRFSWQPRWIGSSCFFCPQIRHWSRLAGTNTFWTSRNTIKEWVLLKNTTTSWLVPIPRENFIRQIIR